MVRKQLSDNSSVRYHGLGEVFYNFKVANIFLQNFKKWFTTVRLRKTVYFIFVVKIDKSPLRKPEESEQLGIASFRQLNRRPAAI